MTFLLFVHHNWNEKSVSDLIISCIQGDTLNPYQMKLVFYEITNILRIQSVLFPFRKFHNHQMQLTVVNLVEWNISR